MATDYGQIAGAAAQTLGNYAVQVAANKKQFKYQKEAMDIQNRYNREFWDYQNAYNTPQQQMSRFKAAGLNPNLIYGGGSASAGNAGPLQAAEVPSRKAATAEIPDLMMRRLMVRQMDAQYQATTQGIEVAKTRAALNEINAALGNLKTMEQGARSKYFEKNAMAEARLREFVSQRAKTLNANEFRKGELMDQLQVMREKQMPQIDLDTQFKRYRNELASLGIYQSDDVKWRVLLRAANRMGIDIGSLLAEGAKKLKYLLE